MIRLAVRCRPEMAERVLADLVQLAPGGVEEEHGDGYVEYAIYGPPGEVPELPDLEAAAGDGLVEIETTAIPDDWADRWRDFHEPVWVAGGRMVVRPSWEDPAAHTPEVDIVVDPGRAFGTGAHATTRACLELLLGLADAGEAGGPLADWGTGSGVLAIAAAKLGFSPVVAIDRDEAAVAATRANAAVNRVQIEARVGDVLSDAITGVDVGLANLERSLVEGLAARPAPGTLVVSGFLASDRLELSRWRREDRRVRSGWAAELLRRA